MILRNITIAEQCPYNAYKSLILFCPDSYVNNMYSRALKAGFASHKIVEINASILTVQDLLPRRENVFLRGLSETKDAATLFLIYNCEQLDADSSGELYKILDYSYRKKFKLTNSAISFDLSGIRLVMFSDKSNRFLTHFSEVCDTVSADPVKENEKNGAILLVF